MTDILTGKVERRKEETLVEFNRRTYGRIIRAHREALGYTQQQLAEQLGLAKNQIAHWEAGRARPDLNDIPRLCYALHITITEFFGTRLASNEIPFEHQRLIHNYSRLTASSRNVINRTIEVMLECEAAERRDKCLTEFRTILRSDQRVCAGALNPLDSEQRGEQIYIRANELINRADEVIVVSGDSMEPTYYDGDELLVQYTTEPNYGDIGIFLINGEGFVKEFRGDGVYSHNSDSYPFRRFEEYDDVRYVGRVIGKLDESYYPDEEELAILHEKRKR